MYHDLMRTVDAQVITEKSNDERGPTRQKLSFLRDWSIPRISGRAIP